MAMDQSSISTASIASRPALPDAAARLRAAIVRVAPTLFWACLSVGMFAGIWEACWALGWADPKLLPPPHIFLGDIVEQAKYFNTANRWQIGVDQNSGP